MKSRASALAVLFLVTVSLSSCGRNGADSRSDPGLGTSTGAIGWKQAMGLTEERRLPVIEGPIGLKGKDGQEVISPLEISIYLDSSFSPSGNRVSFSTTLEDSSRNGREDQGFGLPPPRSTLTLTGPLPTAPFSTLNVIYDPSKYRPVSLRSDLIGDSGYQLFYLFRLREPEGGRGIIPIAIANSVSAADSKRGKSRYEHENPTSRSGYLKIIEIKFERRPADNLRLISKAPTADAGNVITLTATTDALTWREARWGDWNNDGVVTAQDISPLALKFGKSSDQASPDYWAYAGYVDASGDGIVGASDLSPIAFHFGESTGGYNIYQADDANGTNAQLIKSFTRPPADQDSTNPPFGVSLATMNYTYTGTAPDPPILKGRFYRVVPFDTSSPPEESTDVASGWVETLLVGKPPVAKLLASPTSGFAPLTVDFDATGSTDPDGTIALYEFDFNGDSNYEQSNTTGTTQITYSTKGRFNAVVRVTDNDSFTDTDRVVIDVEGNDPPVAVIAADVTSGPAPLDVSFDGTASYDTDVGDSITLYEWDFDGDGLFEMVNNTGIADTTYDVFGNYGALLRVTDKLGANGADTAAIEVKALPIASVVFDPSFGRAPLTVDFDATGSTDPDGAVVLYEFDFQGDRIYDVTNSTGIAQFTYELDGRYNLGLRVTDDDGYTASLIFVVGVGAVGRGDWWMFGREATHNRTSPFTGSQTGTLKWRFQTGNLVMSSPAIAQDGTLYVGSTDGYLYALNSDGTMKWRYLIGDWVTSSPAIGEDGTVYVGSKNNNLYAFSPIGLVNWTFTSGGQISSSPVVGPDGRIYVGCNNYRLYTIDEMGIARWTYPTSGPISSSAAVDLDGTIYIGSEDWSLYVLRPDGNRRWKFQTGGSILSSPAVGSDGTIYFGSGDHKIYAVTFLGTLKWEYLTDGSVHSSPALDPDGTVYAGSYDGYLYAINPDGTLKWRYQTGSGIYSSPAVGADGTVYVGSQDTYLYAINPDGTLKWRYQTSGVVQSSPAIGLDGTVYVGSNDGFLYAFAD